MIPLFPERIPEEITEEDRQAFARTVSVELSPEQIARILEPTETFPGQPELLAIHWHPEFVPLELIERRIAATFPDMSNALIIPTQHNILMRLGEYFGAEVDCYSQNFNQKVQLLVHFAARHESRAGVLESMLAYTFRYRSSQLFDLLETIVRPIDARLDAAAHETGADERLIHFVRAYARKLQQLLKEHQADIPAQMIKNKLLRDFLDKYREVYGDALIFRAQVFVRAVKQIVKAEFPLSYFYRTEEIIEEARSIGAGIVIPHPEQFWPVLLAEYDVDGYEVWNPQSRRYTDFLIELVGRRNRQSPRAPRLLVFMGDDTHLGEKLKPVREQDPAKAGRDIGVQPPWEELRIRKKLIVHRMGRRDVIEEYRARLGG
ncbi:MAG: hypothetical protein GF330_09960 [Candidatus Eisenbacteria bacterium]|nr:hypothetical protein [Candidatus Eisenbacteria bacterium]